MKRFWSLVSVAFFGIVALVGIDTTSVFASQHQLKADQVTETTPLYLVQGKDLATGDELTSFHSSHRSHYSHQSHRSHYSHYSSR